MKVLAIIPQHYGNTIYKLRSDTRGLKGNIELSTEEYDDYLKTIEAYENWQKKLEKIYRG